MTHGPVTSGSLLQVLFALGTILALLGAIAWFLKKSNLSRGYNNPAIQLISGLSLGSKEKVYLLRVGEQCILIGATAQQINPLHHFSANELSDEPAMASVDSASGFKQVLQQVLSRTG